MIAAEIVVAFGKAPRNRKARNDGARGLVAMRVQHRGADAVAMEAFGITRFVERQQFGLLLSPAFAIMLERGVHRLLQAEQRPQSRFLGQRSETDRKHSAPVMR